MIISCIFFQAEAAGKSNHDAYFKFEPFVLHVQCRTLEHARNLVNNAAK